MLIDSKQYAGSCGCGHTHTMDTELVVIEPGCLADYEGWLQKAGLDPRDGTVLYDQNTYQAKGLRRPPARQEIILDPQGLHATEKAVAKVMDQLDRPAYLVAVGAGTIHDIARYCAADLSLPFVAVPTAASVDGFCSTVAAMTWHGYKKTMPGVAPRLVIADIDVIRQAPFQLALSGVGDILGKVTSLADWKIASLLTGEFYCERVADMTMQAATAVQSCCVRLPQQDPEAYEQLIYGLILSGLAMQMVGNSRPASAAEHHISHFIELELEGFGPCGTLHGERVGVGTILVCDIYHKLAAIEEIRGEIAGYTPFDRGEVEAVYGSLTDDVFAENTPNSLADVAPEVLAQKWPEIRKVIAGIPTGEELYGVYGQIGAKRSFADIDVEPALLPKVLRYSPLIRNRLTTMRILWMLRPEVFQRVTPQQ